MINELYELTGALHKADIQMDVWHLKYLRLPKIRAKNPCLGITLAHGKIVDIRAIPADYADGIRKYGTNQGSYPGMNLTPLYKVTNEDISKKIKNLKPEELTSQSIAEIKALCTESNWNKKYLNKFNISMTKVPTELSTLIPDCQPLQILMGETNYFTDPEVLHKALTNAAFQMLEKRDHVSEALTLLFQFYSKDTTENQSKKQDTENLSVVFESERLIEQNVPVIDKDGKFTKIINQALLQAELRKDTGQSKSVDAFGIPVQNVEEKMPKVKLAGGMEVTLRTMFKGQPCQTRYGRIESASYPIATNVRKEIQAALEWLGNEEHKNIYWINTDKGEILFVYPLQLPQLPISFTQMFQIPSNPEETFSTQARLFLDELRMTRNPDTDPHAQGIRLFVLRKLDKARTKVVYTWQTDAEILEQRSETWTIGCTENVPSFSFGRMEALFPLEIATIENGVWKQDGEIIEKKGRTIPAFRGLTMLLDETCDTATDLHIMSRRSVTIAGLLGQKSIMKDWKNPIWNDIRKMMALIGLLLYQRGIRKEYYMDNLPYLYGQLLKAADEIHVLYCQVVRGGDVPPQLIGGSLYQQAAEAPMRTLNLLSKRLMPYYTWARSYRSKNIQEKGKESWRAAWLYKMCEKIMTQLHAVWTDKTRFNDSEKVQLFIGYLAAFPKNEKPEDIKEAENHE
ncbi:hypothetical protein [uncultured Megasphaera sp.]|uniref:hypothetical protein n=1 Tax=uncultured Megasphaera sp. TaxID=165188 RepID=UPI0025988A00|nr:hypothetical protein [uncultured Megasphaera sp.]